MLFNFSHICFSRLRCLLIVCRAFRRSCLIAACILLSIQADVCGKLNGLSLFVHMRPSSSTESCGQYDAARARIQLLALRGGKTTRTTSVPENLNEISKLVRSSFFRQSILQRELFFQSRDGTFDLCMEAAN